MIAFFWTLNNTAYSNIPLWLDTVSQWYSLHYQHSLLCWLSIMYYIYPVLISHLAWSCPTKHFFHKAQAILSIWEGFLVACRFKIETCLEEMFYCEKFFWCDTKPSYYTLNYIYFITFNCWLENYSHHMYMICHKYIF